MSAADLRAAEEKALQAAVKLVTTFEAEMAKDPKLFEWLKTDAPGAVKMRGLRARVKAYQAEEAERRERLDVIIKTIPDLVRQTLELDPSVIPAEIHGVECVCCGDTARQSCSLVEKPACHECVLAFAIVVQAGLDAAAVPCPLHRDRSSQDPEVGETGGE